MSGNNIADEFREKWISKIYTTHFETMPEAVRWIRENITDDMEASIHLYKLATENLKEEIETLKAENSKMRQALEDDGWIKIKDFAIANLPDYDELVLWRDESGKYFCEMLDKDGNPWLEKPYKVTHYKKITHPKE